MWSAPYWYLRPGAEKGERYVEKKLDRAGLRAAFSGRRPGIQDVTGEYAVLVPLIEGPAGWELLFEVRAATLRRQPGEVCFPGGRMEGAESPAACALRETGEELGIPAAAVEVVAELDVLLHQSGFLLRPVLGVVDPASAGRLTLQPAEVAETFRVPLDFFRQNPPACPSYPLEPCPGPDFPYEAIGFPQGYPFRGGRVEVPIYRWENRAIWGLTGRIVRHLVEVLD